MKKPIIDSILHGSVIVSDTNRSLLFYVDVLGLTLDDNRPDLGYPGAWLNIGEQQQIHLLELPNPDPVEDRPEHGGRDRHLAFSVNDINAIQQVLASNKIDFTISKSGRKALFVRDPDGNALEFIQPA